LRGDFAGASRCEIKRHARFRFGLVLRETFFHQLAELRVAVFRIADVSGVDASSGNPASTEAARGEAIQIESCRRSRRRR